MKLDDIVDIVRRVPMLAHLDPVSLKQLAQLMTPVELAADDVLFHEGLPGGAMAVVVSGRLSVRARGHGGGDAAVGSVYPGEIVGEMACIDPAPRNASVVATKPAHVLCLTAEAFDRLEREAPAVTIGIRHGILRQLALRIRQTNDRIDNELARRGVDLEPTGELEAEVPGEPLRGRLDLRQVPSLKDFPNAQLETLATLAPPRTYPRGRVLCREGEVGMSAWLLARGKVAIRKRIRKEHRQLAILTDGALVGQLALIDESPRSATVTVLEDSVLMRIRREPFQALLGDYSPMAMRFQHQIAVSGVRQLRNATESLASLLTAARDDAIDLSVADLPVDQTVRQLSYLRAATGEWGMEVAEAVASSD